MMFGHRIDHTNLQVGDTFYEDKYPMMLTVTVATTVSDWNDNGTIRKQWRWTANDGSRDINYLITEGLEHYGPSISSQQMYARFT